MNVLWITNIALPSICKALDWPVPAIGGWMQSSLNLLKNTDVSSISVATVYPGNKLIKRAVDGITYYLLPLYGRSMTSYNVHLESLWRHVNNDVRPDVIHIHGSEFPHGLAYVKACGNYGVVVSIQGIVSRIARYYLGGVDASCFKLTFRDVVKRGGILKEQREFERRGELEELLLRSVDHVIGRTEWDKSHIWAINPNAQYYHCGETLRNVFYHNQWNYLTCEPHSIFVSQSSYPIKGLHMLIKSMPLILREYEDAMVYIAGIDETTKPWYRISGYGRYLKQLIKECRLEGHIIFTGMLSEEQMCKRYLDSNVFVCCSAIENSPNSLGEAQLLGVPYLAAFVGGTPEIVNYNESVLYRFEEYEMLAKKICYIFDQGSAARGASFNHKMYDGEENLCQLMRVYSSCSQNKRWK